jgi:S-adenosylmethionine hydrolase
MPASPPIITLLTDFGTSEGYVGAMKGVILSIAPNAQLIDLTHQIGPQDIQRAALVLVTTCCYFPPEAVHLVVVDPGVGGQRRLIAMQTQAGRFVAPDNGVLSYVLAREPDAVIVELKAEAYRLPNSSYTFHGRDIFSPAAAHLAAGVDLHALGPRIDDPVRISLPRVTCTDDALGGEVLHIDHFGNILTSIMQLRWTGEGELSFEPLFEPIGQTPPPFDAARAQATLGWHVLDGVHPTYSAAALGQAVAIVGSDGELEIAVNGGNASHQLSAQTGDRVTLYLGV